MNPGFRPPRPALSLTLLAALALAGCAGDEREPPGEPPRALLAEAFANPVPSGEAEIDLDLRIEGDSPLAGEAFADLDGPFRRNDGGGLPGFDLALEGEAAGFGVEGSLVSTGEDAFVVFFGENYRVGPEHVSAIEDRLDAAGDIVPGLGGWFADPRYAGAEEAGGVEAQRISARLEPRAVASRLGALARAAGARAPATIAQGIGRGRAEAWVAFEDRTVRRLRIELSFTVPPGADSGAAGIESGDAAIEVELSDLGAEAEIAPPPGGGFNPIEQLISRIRGFAGL